MTRLFLLFLFSLLVQVGFGGAFAQTYSLHLIPGGTSHDAGRGERSDDRTIVGSVEQREHRRGGLDGGEVVHTESFTDAGAMLAAYAALHIDLFNTDFIPCVVPGAAEEGASSEDDALVAKGGTSGNDGLPAGFGDGWSGSKGGGCGTWATAMCNRILGKASGTVTKDEWNEIADGIKQGADGGSTATDRAAYYQGEGCASSQYTFKGTPGEYAWLKRKIEEGYDIKLSFYKIVKGANGDVTYENGHVETVTGVTTVGGKPVALTNSWGSTARVAGGTENGFSHSRQGATGGFGAGTWPAGATSVDLTLVGPCK